MGQKGSRKTDGSLASRPTGQWGGCDFSECNLGAEKGDKAVFYMAYT